jgi:D-arabinose 1-dehydrogenase-like Zn-dependent alcohol dehydrogenase
MVLAGVTSSYQPEATGLNRIFFRSLSVVGSVMGTRSELSDLVALMVSSGVRAHRPGAAVERDR